MLRDVRVQSALMIVAVLCAVIMTSLVVRREISSAQTPRDDGVRLDSATHLVSGAPHSFGPDDAQVTLVEFVDLQCPACKQFAAVIDSVQKAGRVRVRVAIRHYPIAKIHPVAPELALASLCLRDSASLVQYHRRAYELQDVLSARSGTVGPMQLMPTGVDTAAVRRCMRDPATWDALAAEIRVADEAGVQMTPSCVIGNRLFAGTRSVEEVERLLMRWGDK
jgi:protein-disulfide isomerase